jgi:hypothetical protein
MDLSSSYKEDVSGNSLIIKELKINMQEASISKLQFLNLNNIDTTLDTSTLTLTFDDFLLPVVDSIVLDYNIEIEQGNLVTTCNTYLKDDNNKIGLQMTTLNTTSVIIQINTAVINVSNNIRYSPVIEINSDSLITVSKSSVNVYSANNTSQLAALRVLKL